jgi:hypothetical protein
VLGARGAPPSLVSPPTGCRFHPRCPFAMAVCARDTPPALPVTEDHVAACWRHATGLSAAQAAPLATGATAAVTPGSAAPPAHAAAVPAPRAGPAGGGGTDGRARPPDHPTN